MTLYRIDNACTSEKNKNKFIESCGGSVAEWFVRLTTKLPTRDSIPGSDGTSDWLFSAV